MVGSIVVFNQSFNYRLKLPNISHLNVIPESVSSDAKICAYRMFEAYENFKRLLRTFLLIEIIQVECLHTAYCKRKAISINGLIYRRDFNHKTHAFIVKGLLIFKQLERWLITCGGYPSFYRMR